jgi:hypothetical protein
MKSAIFLAARNPWKYVQPTLPSKNKIAPDLSEHDCTNEVTS